MGFIIKSSNFLLRKIALIGIICSLGSGMFAQTVTTDSVEVSGNIVGLSESVCEYRLTFSTSRGDSLPTVVLFSDVFREKRFHIKLQQVATPLTLNVNAVGYKVVHRDLGIVNGKYDIGAIKLTNDSTIDLSAVVVSAKRPLVVEQGMKSKYQISGSMLSEAGTLMALFRRLPNLSVDNGKLTVLDSYGIETIKKINDYIYNDIDLTYTQGRRPYGNVGTNVRAKFGKVSMGMSYRYAYNNRLIDDEEFRLMPKDGSDLNLVDNIRTKEKEYKHNVLVNLEYTPNEQTNWSLLYNSTFTQQGNDVATSRSMQTVTGLKSIRLMQNFPTSEYSHSLSIGLNKAIGKGALTLLADYAVANNTTNFSTTEQDLSSSSYQEVLTKMNSKSHIANILAKYNFTGPLGIAINTGMKSNVVVMPTNYNLTTKKVSIPEVQDVKTLEQSNVIFLDAEKWITKHLQLQTGLSYDFTYQDIKYKKNDLDQSAHKQYHNIIPSFSVAYLLAARSFVALGLSVPFTKPRFDDIVPSAIYKDALLYEQREPNVKATRTYMFTGMWRYNSFSVRALISHSPLFYEHTYERLSPSSFAMKRIITPFYDQTFSQLTMNYSKQWSNGLLIQANSNFYYRPNFINGEVAKHHLTYYPMLTIGYNNPTIYAWATISYINETSNGIQWVDRTGFNIDAGATINLLKGKLTIDVTTPNLTRINVPTQYSINGGMKWGVRPINRDCEFFNITIRYKLFNKDVMLQQQRGNSEELNRILK